MKNFTFSLLLILLVLAVGATDNPCFPRKNNKILVYDESHLLNSQQDALLEQKLEDFANTTSNQIVLVIVDDLCGMDRAQFATQLGQEWGVGQAKMNNGIVVLIKPKTSSSRGEAFIAVGRGLEGIITDASTFLIVDNEMIPNFKSGLYFEGINQATDVLMQLARQEYSTDEYAQQNSNESKSHGGGGVFVMILIVLFISIISRVSKTNRYAKLNHVNWWTAFWLISAASNRKGGYWGDFRSGSGGFGGGSSSGGGFGGFGGGGFGGGGSGGSW